MSDTYKSSIDALVARDIVRPHLVHSFTPPTMICNLPSVEVWV